jgi:hypothetical protein
VANKLDDANDDDDDSDDDDNDDADDHVDSVCRETVESGQRTMMTDSGQR